MSDLPDYADALCRAMRIVRPLWRAEQVELAGAGGRVLAQDVKADRDLPPFNRAQMDGYALRAAEYQPGKPFRVVASIAAGSAAAIDVPPRCCVAIATGAPLPPGLDAVIAHEASDQPGGGLPSGGANAQPVAFALPAIAPGHAVHARGADAKAGAVLAPRGTMLGAHHLGICAAAGAAALTVAVKPAAIVLSSGNELAPIGAATDSLAPHQIRNSNAPMLDELLRRMGAAVCGSHHLRDELEPTVLAVRSAIARANLVITIGGVSAGERDFFPRAFEATGVDAALRGAAIQPGRPIFLGGAPSGAIVVGLPGNPVSALACSCLFIWPIVRVLLGLNDQLPWRDVRLAEAVKPNPHRRAFRPAILRSDGTALVPPWAGSGDLVHTAPTHGLAELPVQHETVAAGTRVRFLPWP